MIGLGFLFLILSLVRITKLGVVLHWVWAKLESSLAFYFANLTARDVMRAKSTILQAEIALDTRIHPCNHASTHVAGTVNRCTELRDGKSLLAELDKALNGQQNSAGFSTQLAGSGINDADVRKQAISVGLFKCLMKDMKEDTFPADIASRLRPILDLLHRIHLDQPAAHADAVTQMLDSFKDSLWSAGRSNSCLNENEVKLMKVQLQASMLLYHFNEPSVVNPSITGRTLNEWLQTRRSSVPGVEFCDFI